MKPRIIYALSVYCLALCFGACGGGGGGSAANQNLHPSNLSIVTNNSDIDLLVCYWDPPTIPFDGYEFEGKVGSESYSKWHNGLLPRDWEGIRFYLSKNDPEATDYHFRLRAATGAAYTDYSNEISYHKGIYAPELLGWTGDIQTNVRGGITINWKNNSQVADSIKLERGISSDMGVTYSWTTIAGIPFGATSYIDSNYPESSWLSYRVTYSKGSDGASGKSDVFTSPLAAPLNLSGTLIPGGARLQWVNRSSNADELVIMRKNLANPNYSFYDIASISPTLSIYEDTQLPTGFYAYRVEARKSGRIPASSVEIKVATAPPPGGISLQPGLVQMPNSVASVVDSKGKWYFAEKDETGSSILCPTSSGWTTHKLDNVSSWYSPYVVLDAQDRPHAIYLQEVTPGSQDNYLVHTWFNGTSWQTENIARRTFYTAGGFVPYTYAMDLGGSLHIIWLNNNGSPSTDDLEYAHRDPDGTWKVERLDIGTTPVNIGSLYQLVVDGNGTPHLIAGFYLGVYHMVRTGENAWVNETVPVGSLPGDYYASLACVAIDNVNLMVFFERYEIPYDPNNGYDYELCVLRKTAGSWGTVQPIANRAADSLLFPTGVVAHSSNWGRVAVTYRSTAENRLLVYENNAWSTTKIGAPNYWCPSIGFDNSAKLHLLQKMSNPTSTTGDALYANYVETP